jgi:hypothetical protein
MKTIRKDQYTVRVQQHNEKIGDIFMPSYKFSAEHNVVKQFRFQICEIVKTHGIRFAGLKTGDKVMIRRWTAKNMVGGLAALRTSRILAKIE